MISNAFFLCIHICIMKLEKGSEKAIAWGKMMKEARLKKKSSGAGLKEEMNKLNELEQHSTAHINYLCMCCRSKVSPSGVALTSLRPASVKHHLRPHFTELKLADIVSDYLGNPFISTWQVGTQYVHIGDKELDEKDELKTHAMHITLPLDADGTYDFTVDWGDGSSAHIVSHDQAEVKHTYGCKGEYTVQLNGIVKGFGFGSHGDDDDDEAHPCSQQGGA